MPILMIIILVATHSIQGQSEEGDAITNADNISFIDNGNTTTSKPKNTPKQTTKLTTPKKTLETLTKAETTKMTTTKNNITQTTTTEATTTEATTIEATTIEATTAEATTTEATTTEATRAKSTTTEATRAKSTRTTETRTTETRTTETRTTETTTNANITNANMTNANMTNANTTKPTNLTTTEAPPPTNLEFTVKDNGTICLWFKGVISINVTTNYSEEMINLKKDGANATGNCSAMDFDNHTSTIMISYNNSSVKLKMTFKGGDVWYMSALSVVVGDLHASATYKSSAANGKLFQAQSNHSYFCTEDHSLKLMSRYNGSYSITVDFKKVSIQPFAAAGGESYINAVACRPSTMTRTPYASAVEIAVGCSLAVLIVIVLITYIVGRTKGLNNRDYQKV